MGERKISTCCSLPKWPQQRKILKARGAKYLCKQEQSRELCLIPSPKAGRGQETILRGKSTTKLTTCEIVLQKWNRDQDFLKPPVSGMSRASKESASTWLDLAVPSSGVTALLGPLHPITEDHTPFSSSGGTVPKHSAQSVAHNTEAFWKDGNHTVSSIKSQ